MTRKKSSTPWERPDGITLKEMVHALEWFGVHVSFDGLRQTTRLLKVPATPNRGERGRGITAYYDDGALWMLATAYRRVATPKSRFENIAAELASLEIEPCEPYSIADVFTDEPLEEPRDLARVREAYLAFVCDEHNGLDPRVITDVARSHWAESGLDDQRLSRTLRLYKETQLLRLGVPAAVARSVSLTGRSLDSCDHSDDGL